jgi:hypothetical protein
MTRFALCIARCSHPRTTVELAGVRQQLPYCVVTMNDYARLELLLRAHVADDRYFAHTERSAVQLHAEAGAARLRSGAEAPRVNPSVAGGTPADITLTPLSRRAASSRRAALASARGPWPHSLA